MSDWRKDGLPMPSISDYVDALANPQGRFRTLGEVAAQLDARGEVRFLAGNNAAVFPVVADGVPKMLKCYIKKGLHAREVYSFIVSANDPLLSSARLLEDEIFVYDAFDKGRWYDVVIADWIDGITLETAIRRAAKEEGEAGFARLSAAFDSLACALLSRGWAHGDLKPENIIVDGRGALRLVDFDAMFIPALAGRETLEVGTPQYQHPARDEKTFDRHMDDYPSALISASLRALALDASLYAKYNKRDNIIMYPEEILSGESSAYRDVLALFDAYGDRASYELALALTNPSPHIAGLRGMITGNGIIPAHSQPVMVADIGNEYSPAPVPRRDSD